ncbi:hypothetical protein AB5N19_04537 [Seiridium cardinale]
MGCVHSQPLPIPDSSSETGSSTSSMTQGLEHSEQQDSGGSFSDSSCTGSCYSADSDPFLWRLDAEVRAFANADIAITNNKNDDVSITQYLDTAFLPRGHAISLDDHILSNVEHRRRLALSVYIISHAETGCWLRQIQIHGSSTSDGVLKRYPPTFRHGERCGCRWSDYGPGEATRPLGLMPTIGVPKKLSRFVESLVDEEMISENYAGLLEGKLFMDMLLPLELRFYRDSDSTEGSTMS